MFYHNLTFRKPSGFPRGTLFRLLENSYSYDPLFKEHFLSNWQECDEFFYDNLAIADSCCVVTCLGGKAIGFICWDPRNIPDYIEIGHNCIAMKHKGKGYGKKQLEEALSRIQSRNIGKITVTTNEALYAAQRNYESCGFIEVGRRRNSSETRFSGDYIDYEISFE